MKLKLTNFKIFENRTFIFPDTGIVLLNGENGVGKSTIFSAILFALYGIGKKLVTWDKKSCTVILIYKELEIKRGKRPNILHVVHNKREYEKDMAQEIIDRFIGMNCDLFLKTSYIQQKKFSNLFLSLSPTERLKLIQTISLNGETSMYKEPIKNKIRELKDSILKERTQLESLKSVFNSDIDFKNIRILEIETNIEDKIDGECREIETMNKKLEKIRDELNKRQIFIQKIRDKKREYEKYMNEAKERERELEYLRSTLLDLKKEENKKTRRVDTVQLRTEIAKTENLVDLITEYEDTVSLLQKHEKDIELSVTKIKKQLKEYRNLETLISLYESMLLNEENRKRRESAKKNISKLFREIKKLDPTLKDIKSVKQMLATLKEMRESIVVFKCPNCEEFISLGHNNQVSISKRRRERRIPIGMDQLYINLERESTYWSLVVKEFEEDIKSIRTEIDTVKKLDDNLHRLERDRGLSFNKILERVKREGRERHRIDFEKTDLKKLKQDKILLLELQLKESEELKLRINEEETRTKKIGETESSIFKLERKIKSHRQVELDDDILLLETYNSELTLLSREMADITSQILKKRDILETLEIQKKIIEHREQQQRLEELEIKLRESEELLKGYQSLKDIDKQAEILTVRQTISAINEAANRYISLFFSNPINIQLVESERSKVQNIVVEISYKGQVLDTVDILSGGEIQRCDLSFLFGINEMNNGKIVLLDECFSFISGEGHETIVSNLEQMCKDKLIILVSHRAIEGNFSCVVDL